MLVVPGVQPVVAITDAPHRDELIDALQVPARLRRAVSSGLRSDDADGVAVSNVRSPFSLRRKYSPCSLKYISVGLKFGAHFRIPSSTHNLRLAGEAVGDGRAGRIDVVVDAILRRGREIRGPDLPGGAGSEIAAEVGEEVARAEAVLVAPAVGSGRKAVAAPRLHAEVEIERRRRHPFQLDAVVAQLVAEKRLVGERCVGEVPGVRVDLVLVADARRKTARP